MVKICFLKDWIKFVKDGMNYNIDIMTLASPVYVVGMAIRVTHGTPECFPAIHSLCEKFRSEEMASKIPDKVEPIIQFGICSGHVYNDDLIEFTYMTGVQTQRQVDLRRLPAKTMAYVIPEGDYARIRVKASSAEEAIGIAYVQLDQWIKLSADWESVNGEYEVYPNESSQANMELWRPVKRKR